MQDLKRIAKEFAARSDVTGSEYEFHGKEALQCSEAAAAWLKVEVGNCPACMLSVLLQTNTAAFDVFDYKKAIAEWHAEKSRDERDLLM